MVKWNLSEIYNFEDTDKILAKIKRKVKKAKSFRKELKNSLNEKRFMEILKELESIGTLSAKLSGYASLWLTEKTDSSERNTHDAKISQALTELGNELIFFGLWFKELNQKDADRFIKSSGKYAYHLKSVRQFKKYTLKENEEQIINIKDLTGDESITRFYDIITNSFLFDFEGKKVTQADIVTYVRHPSAKKRELAYKNLLKKYKENDAILGEIYKSLVQSWVNENVGIRKFKSPISARNLGNDIDDKIVDTMLNVVRKNIPIFHEYFKLKAKLLGYKKLSRFHIYAPIKKSETKYTYKEGKDLVLNTYKEFSELAHTYAKEIFDLKHFDSEVKQGKQNGAFCSSISKNIAPYILQSYNGKISDVFTMMHEFGHGIHGRAARDQTEFTFHSSTPMAETASIFGETLLEKKMLKQSNKKDKISILMRSLDDKYASIIRQAYIVVFEKLIYDKINQGCTIEEINKYYLENLKEQFGNSVEIPDIFQHEWKYILHFFHYPFYCYSYAFGNLLALSFYGIYEEQGEKFVDNYMNVLAAGGSDSPQNIIKKELGLNITKELFWQKAFDLIRKDLNELKKLV